VGDKVSAGDVLLSIAAMKMETAIHAEADGVIAEVTVKPGDQIDGKDLVRFAWSAAGQQREDHVNGEHGEHA
jgi:pyruvate carboxylase